MKIKLTQTAHIPDEGWDPEDPENEGKPRPVATNYAGATLEVSDELGEQLITDGKAVDMDAPPPIPAGPEGE